MSIWQDLRRGARGLPGRPGISVAAVLTLALGIAACTTIFTLVDSILLRPLPLDQPERVVGFWGAGSWAKGELQYLRDQTDSYDEVAAFSIEEVVLTGLDQPLSLPVAVVSANFLTALGVQPSLGRGFLADDEKPGHPNVVLISDGLWRGQLGADPLVIGSMIVLDETSFEVIGVMPARFGFPARDMQAWLPLTMDPAGNSYRGGFYLSLVGRLSAGTTLAQAQTELEAFVPRLQQEFGLRENFDKLAEPTQVLSYHAQIVGQTRPMLLLLLGAVAFLMLIACANIANLLLAQGLRREREIGIRTALGAGRLNIIRQLMTESCALALAGGGIGLLMSVWGLDRLVAFLPAGSPRIEEITLDHRAVLFCLGLSLLTVFLFGMAPALHTSRRALQGATSQGTRSTGKRSQRRVREGLVVAEMALAVILVMGAGLMARSFLQLGRVDPGFNTDSVLAFRISLASSRYGEQAVRSAFYDEAMLRLGALPGVESVGANWRLPIAEPGSFQLIEIQGRPQAPGDPPQFAYWRTVAGDYFQAMEIPLVSGRLLTSADRADATEVCVINQSMARKYWPDGTVLGQQIRNSMDQDTWITVVGVVGDVRHNGLDQPADEMLYRPYAQAPPYFPDLSMVVRASSDPAALFRSITTEIHELDATVPVYRVQTTGQIVADSIAAQRITATLVGLFGGLALVLAAVGIFGVFSFSVTQRTGEIGVRMALGARQMNILGMVLREGLRLSLVGIAVGTLGALALSRLLSSLLFAVSPTDPLTFTLVPALLLAVAIAACYLPGRWASRINPIVSLRQD